MEDGGVQCRGDFDYSAEDGFNIPAVPSAAPKPEPSLPEKIKALTAACESSEAALETARGDDDQPAMKRARKALKKSIADLEGALEQRAFQNDIEEIRSIFAELDHPEAPGIGQKFLTNLDETGCKIVIDPNFTSDVLSLKAAYVSYSYGPQEPGFINEIGVNKFKLRQTLSMFDSISHEGWHALQKAAAPALHLSPFNPNTRILVHPADWILLEGLCEDDAYAKGGFLNYLVSQTEPTMRNRSKFDLVSVENFEDALKDYPPLHNALVHVALNARYKRKKEWDPQSELFTQHYLNVALNNYIRGMNARRNQGETGHIFVRLENHDFYAVGDYGVGPNSLGVNGIDPGFVRRLHMVEEELERYNKLCADHKIPPLYSCPTLAEYRAREAGLTTRRTDQPLQMVAGGQQQSGNHFQMV